MADLSSPSLPLSRKQYTRAHKADIVEQSMAPGVSIASVAMAHGINANQLHKWRYLYKKGEFVPLGWLWADTALLLAVIDQCLKSVRVGAGHIIGLVVLV